MVAGACERVMDRKVTIILSISTVAAPNQDQGLLMSIRKKDMINMIIVIHTFIMI